MNTKKYEGMKAWVRRVLLLAPCALLLAACSLPTPQSDSVRHFTLSGPRDAAAVADAVSVRPVRLAGHLRSRAMAVRVSENEIVYLEDMRWAEPLDEAITQILRNRLRQVGGGASVSVQVQRCEVDRSAGDRVLVAATYTITPSKGEPHTGVFSSSPRTWSGGKHAELVGLLREAVTELAEAVAADAAK